ncbi:hypothetical protein BIV57_18805 [Mangrovactinospora gilvigrisea]|uniref:ATP-grasp domain-containing protein n=1 Tax=Mangrovactinospora gilvigrisea TaxID=1428644 RepID=A0A1J7C8K8_9ACTN|nr:ATP-grasp domain-containing protein [Mangrovactinospora gilvigrisea]OIV35970.1 hypothetical protein BIV57_18805 [Mangrovactinospora gilvigrisea]
MSLRSVLALARDPRRGSGHAAAAPPSTGLPPTAAIVAPYGSGALYADEFRRRGWQPAAVTTPDDRLPAVFRDALIPSDYHATVVHTGNLTATRRRLQALGTAAVVAGNEIGTVLAERLAADLNLPGNPPATSNVRRSKTAMAQALARAGLPAPATLRTRHLDEALAFAAGLPAGTGWVLKPDDAAGSDGVTLGATHEQLAAAWHRTHHGVNILGHRNTHLVLQERLTGMQYVVNSISRAGHHHITEIWRDARLHRDGAALYDRRDLLHPDHVLHAALAVQARRVLAALEITDSAAHSEFIHTGDGRLILIETGARAEGWLHPHLATALGSHQVRDHVAVLTGHLLPPPATTRPPRHCAKIHLIAPGPARLTDRGLKELAALPGLIATLGTLTPGTPVVRTRDLMTSPGMAVLAADDPNAIDRAHRALRALEAADLYETA